MAEQLPEKLKYRSVPGIIFPTGIVVSTATELKVATPGIAGELTHPVFAAKAAGDNMLSPASKPHSSRHLLIKNTKAIHFLIYVVHGACWQEYY
jgi:hypothetical protein